MDPKVMQCLLFIIGCVASQVADVAEDVSPVSGRSKRELSRTQKLFVSMAPGALAHTPTDHIPAMISTFPPDVVVAIAEKLNLTERMRVMGSLSGDQIMNLTGKMTQKQRGQLLSYLPPAGVVSLADTLTEDQLGDLLASLSTETVYNLTQSLAPEQNFEIIRRLSPEAILGLMRNMSQQQAMGVLNSLPPERIVNLTDSFTSSQLGELISPLPTKGVASLVSSLPPSGAAILASKMPTDVLINLLPDLVIALPSEFTANLVSSMPTSMVAQLIPTLPGSVIVHIMLVLPQNVTSALVNSLDNSTIGNLMDKLSPGDTIALLKLLEEDDIRHLLLTAPVESTLKLLYNASGAEVSNLLRFVPEDVVYRIISSMPVGQIVNLTRTFPADNLARLLLALNPTHIESLLKEIPQDVTVDLIYRLPPQLLGNFTDVLPEDQLIELLLTLSPNQSSELVSRFPPEGLAVLIPKLPPDVLVNLTMSLSQDALVGVLDKLSGDQLSALISSIPPDRIDDLVLRIPPQMVFNLTRRITDLSFMSDLKLKTLVAVLGKAIKEDPGLIKTLISAVLHGGLVRHIPPEAIQGVLESVTPQQIEGLLGKFPPDQMQNLVGAIVPDLLKKMTQSEDMSLSAILTPEVTDTLLEGVSFSNLLGLVGQLLPKLPLMIAKSVGSLAQSPLVHQNGSGDTGLQQCFSDIQLFLTSLSATDQWAVDMFDAYGKPSRGIQKGNTHMYGNYEQCLDVSHVIKNGSKDSRVIKGSYCGVEIGLPPGLLPPAPGKGILPDVVVELYACLPNSCEGQDLQQLFSSLTLPANLTLPRVSCQKDEDISTDAAAIVSICVLGLLGLLMVIGTAYDITHRKDTDSEDPYISGVEAKENEGFELQEPKTVEVDGEAITSFSASSNGGTGYMPNDDDSYDDEDDDKDGSTLARILLAFSLPRNSQRILSVDVAPDTVRCLHGIRVLSIGWLILGYTLYFMSVYFENSLGAAEALEEVAGQVVIHSTLAVDTFFVVSGCLTAILFVREAVAEDGIKSKNVFFYFVHRFIRLTPAYAITIMALTCLLPYMSDGPNWTRDSRAYYSNCNKYWWTNLLYINNFYSSLKDQCIPWSWYLSVDMQFHWIVAPFIIIPLAAGAVSKSVYQRIIGGVLIGGLVFLQIFLTIYFEEDVNGDFLRHSDDFQWEIFQKPYCRAAPYVLGLGFGYALACLEGRKPISKISAAVLWLCSLTVIFAATFVKINENRVMLDDPFHWSHGVRSAHEAIYRPLFSLAISVVVYLCATGNGGFINSILSWRGFLPFSRLTYCIFLLHPAVILADQWQARVPVYFHLSYVAQRAAGYFVITAIFAYVLSVTVEAPITALERVLFKRKRIQSTNM